MNENLEMLQGKMALIEDALGDDLHDAGTGACYCLNTGDFITTGFRGDPSVVMESAAMIIAKMLHDLNVTEGLDGIFASLRQGVEHGMEMYAREAGEWEDHVDE